jgi:ComF family protein
MLPVPLARARFLARGCNQALEIGRGVEKFVGVPMRSDLLERVRETREQVELEAVERRRNVRGAFGLRGSLAYEHVAIIDDVITTGSTAGEIARTLKQAGVSTVEVWAVARTVRPAGP